MNKNKFLESVKKVYFRVMGKEPVYTITVKGVIFQSLGGYMDEENARANSDKVISALVEYLARNEKALISVNGKLEFASFKMEK